MSGPPLADRQLRRFDALVQRSPLILSMDFDGTLAPIVERPSRARMPARVRRQLGVLSRLPGLELVLLSGRSLDDLERRCRLRRAGLVGAHGLTSNVTGVGMPSAERRRWKATLGEAKRRIKALHLGRQGIRIEDKGLGLALHLRRAPALARRALPGRLAKALKGLPILLRPGLRILELRPRGAWHKGRALQQLLKLRPGGWKAQGACFFAGDDTTDEDAFRALRRMGTRALGLKIGPGATQAHCRVQSPAQFWRLLRRIETLRSRREEEGH